MKEKREPRALKRPGISSTPRGSVWATPRGGANLLGLSGLPSASPRDGDAKVAEGGKLAAEKAAEKGKKNGREGKGEGKAAAGKAAAGGGTADVETPVVTPPPDDIIGLEAIVTTTKPVSRKFTSPPLPLHTTHHPPIATTTHITHPLIRRDQMHLVYGS